jgi:dihydropteroate synthase
MPMSGPTNQNRQMISSKIKNKVPGWVVDYSHPRVMGILNCTPDSFSDGGRFNSIDLAITRLDTMVAEGATMIDVGGESTRPGSDPVSVDDELNRVIPVLEIALKKFPDIYFSIDTTKYEVAEAALDLGVDFINDVSGLRKEPRFVQLCSDYDAGIIIMHSVGDPKTMQLDPNYSDVVTEVRDFLRSKVDLCKDAGIRNIIIDPGFGFGKSLDHNLELLRALNLMDYVPVLVGISRKSMLGQLLNGRNTDGRLAATISAHFFALLQGAKILRVHDVQEAVDSVKVFEALNFSF